MRLMQRKSKLLQLQMYNTRRGTAGAQMMMAHVPFMSIYNVSFEQTVFLITLSLAACL